MALHDLDIARRATLRRITDIARERLGIEQQRQLDERRLQLHETLPVAEAPRTARMLAQRVARGAGTGDQRRWRTMVNPIRRETTVAM